jgi:hypothetical protein
VDCNELEKSLKNLLNNQKCKCNCVNDRVLIGSSSSWFEFFLVKGVEDPHLTGANLCNSSINLV